MNLFLKLLDSARHSFVDPRFLGTNGKFMEIHGKFMEIHENPLVTETSHIHPYFLVKLGDFAAGQIFLLLEVS